MAATPAAGRGFDSRPGRTVGHDAQGAVMSHREWAPEAAPSLGPLVDRPRDLFLRIQAARELWERFTAWETPDPEAGQVWRLQWSDVVVLAVIEPRKDPRTFSALPLSEDPQFATDSDLILEPDESPLGMPAMVHVGLEMVLHQRVLDRCLGRIAEQAWKDLLQLRAAFVRSEPSGLPLGRVGPPVTHELDERLQYRAEQREACMPLAFAEWYVPPAGRTAADLIGAWLKENKLSPADLAGRSGVPVQALLELLREEAVDLTESQLGHLASALGVDADELRAALAERLPYELVDVLDAPPQKARVSLCGERWATREPETRRRMARQLASLARRAKRMTAAEWSRLLEQHFPR